MAKSLVIVESPSKAKTIKKILGDNYQVKASAGHIRDLPKKKLGIDLRKKNFMPDYEILPEKEKVVEELREIAKSCKNIYLASDPDREGEAIAWHLSVILGDISTANIKRIEFNEITKTAIKAAIKKPRDIDQPKVNAQQARRLLDRLVGYKISPILWQKIKSGLSAGRVQSVAVRLVCDREEEIEKFIPEEYWTVKAELSKDNNHKFLANLVKADSKKTKLSNEEIVKELIARVEKEDFSVKKVSVTKQKRTPAQPFITSTLQQEAYRKFGNPVKKTMKIAQELYEGIELGDQGPVGLITYMRTDSTRISNEAIKEVRDFILSSYGEEYLPKEARKANISKKAQDAHEAIRPTSLANKLEYVKPYLKPEQFKLYKLIWDRFVASQMENAIVEVTTIDIEAGESLWRAKNDKLVFAGFQVLYLEGKDDEDDKDESDNKKLPSLEKGDKLNRHKLISEQHFTQPSPRYTEASLVKTLEEKGIGRPSTYAPIISTVQDRGYVIKGENKVLFPTELGRQVNEQLVEHFPSIVNVGFSADMETDLDKIESSAKEWQVVLKEFYEPFIQAVKTAKENMKSIVVLSGEKCNLCGRDMVIKSGRFGDFMACQGYPECKNTKPIIKKVGVKCPKDNCDGDIIEKRSRKGKTFYGCSKYPDCSFTSWNMPVEKKCPDCNSYMMKMFSKKKMPYLRCSNDECKKMLNISNAKTKNKTESTENTEK